MIGARRVLRLTAIAIAVAGAADPTLIRDRAVSEPLSLVVIDTPTLDLPAEGGTRRERAFRSAEALGAALNRTHQAKTVVHGRVSGASACPGHGGCVVISDGASPARLTSGAEVIGALRIDTPNEPNVAIAGLSVPGGAHLLGLAIVDVHLRALGVQGTSGLEVYDGNVLVGQASHQWPSVSDITPVETTVRAEWVPAAAGPRRLRVVVTPAAGEVTALDNEAEIGVDVRSDVTPILLIEPEPTWLGTFVRKALENDARFTVRSQTRLGPSLSVSRGARPDLTRAALEDVGTVIVSAPDGLSQAEVDLLDRFVRVRGGSVVFAPDRRPTGVVTRLLPSITAERREPARKKVGALEATEMLIFDAATPGVSPIETVEGATVVAAKATGRGRVIVSGALDAWRYRAGGHFASFWSALVAEASAAARPALDVWVDEVLLDAGVSTNLTVEWRALDVPGASEGAATLRCAGQQEEFVRLWPAARRATFTGTVSPAGAGECAVDVAITRPVRLAATAHLLVTTDAHLTPAPRTIDGAVRAHGGIVLPAGDEASMAARVRERLSTTRQSHAIAPMRSPWWIVPFATCLAGEWWLRRRAGLR